MSLPNCRPDTHRNGKHSLLCYRGALRREWPSIEDMAEPDDFPSVLGRVAGITARWVCTCDHERPDGRHVPSPGCRMCEWCVE